MKQTILKQRIHEFVSIGEELVPWYVAINCYWWWLWLAKMQMIIDPYRTLIIWNITIAFFWNSFNPFLRSIDYHSAILIYYIKTRIFSATSASNSDLVQ